MYNLASQTSAECIAEAMCGPLLFGLIVEGFTYRCAWSFTAATSAVAAVVMVVTNHEISAFAILEEHPGRESNPQSPA